VSEKLIGVYRDMLTYGISESDINAKRGIVKLNEAKKEYQ